MWPTVLVRLMCIPARKAASIYLQIEREEVQIHVRDNGDHGRQYSVIVNPDGNKCKNESPLFALGQYPAKQEKTFARSSLKGIIKLA